MLERGERLDLLVDKSSDLNAAAFTFQRSSKKLKNAMCLAALQRRCFGCALLLLLLYTVVGFTCGWAFQCAQHAPRSNSTVPNDT